MALVISTAVDRETYIKMWNEDGIAQLVIGNDEGEAARAKLCPRNLRSVIHFLTKLADYQDKQQD